MKKKTYLNEWIAQHSILAVIITLGLLLLLTLSFWLVSKSRQDKIIQKKVVTVSFGDGQNEITVDRNGQVTIKTPYGTFSQVWDKEKVWRFFENLDNLDFDKLSEFLGTGLAIELTLNSGKVIVVDASQITEDIIDNLESSLEDTYVQNNLIPIENTGTNPIKTPTPTIQNSDNNSGQDNINPPKDPWSKDSGKSDPESFKCQDVSNLKDGRKIIISNTVCGQ